MIGRFYNQSLNKYLVFLIFLIIGILIFKDFGHNIDEKFHRLNGFYWLRYVSEYLGLDQLSLLSNTKLESIQGFTLSPIDYYNKYGIIFDVPAAIIEIILRLENPIEYYKIRHFLVFLYFYIGLIFFYKILLNRFKNDNIALIGVILLFCTPRLLGDSFQNIKDIVFLTFVIITSYYYFKTVDIFSKKNIVLFALFSAASTTVRMFAIFFPLTFVTLWLFSFSKKKFKKEITYILLFVASYIFFLIFFWPLLWEDTINSLVSYFKILNDYFNAKVFFLNNYYSSNLLPYSYIPIWIIISTPLLHLILFFLGFSNMVLRFFKRFTNIKSRSIYADFWRGKNEQKDFFIFFSFVFITLGVIFLNIKMYNSWRIVYFLYFFIIYFAIYYMNIYLTKYKKNLLKKNIFKFLFLILIILTTYRITIYHPYQSFYFNVLTSDKIKNTVEVDYTGLSSIQFLNKILEENQDKEIIKIGIASWYPLWRMIELIENKDVSKIKLVSNKENYTSDYLYSNRISDVDKRYNKKYDIPSNFFKYDEFIIDGAIIYEVYKRVE